jgi:hypothetical protein
LVGRQTGWLDTDSGNIDRHFRDRLGRADGLAERRVRLVDRAGAVLNLARRYWLNDSLTSSPPAPSATGACRLDRSLRFEREMPAPASEQVYFASTTVETSV